MKILLLNPHLDAARSIVEEVEASGIGVVYARQSEEAWQLLQLHGKSVDLGIIHREGTQAPEDGMDFIRRVKADPEQSDLPFVLTSEAWGAEEFAKHQETPEGANAYLNWPYASQDLIRLIQSLFGDAVTGLVNLTEGSFRAGGIAAPPPFQEPPSSGPTPPPFPFATTSPEILPPPTPTSIFTAESNPVPFPESSDGNSFLEPPAEFALDPPDLPASSPHLTYSSLDISSLDQEQPEGTSPQAEPVLELGAGPSPMAEPEVKNEAEPAPGTVFLQPPENLGEEESIASSKMTQHLGAVGGKDSPDGGSEGEEQLAEEMPYLFSKKSPPQPAAPPIDPVKLFAQPAGDAVVPGGAAHAPDLETLKQYLLLREQDVAVLSGQLKAAQEQVASLESQLRIERASSGEKSLKIEEQEKRIGEFEQEKKIALDGLQGELSELKFQMKTKMEKARLLEAEAKDAKDQIERLKERVRLDIRKIRLREKELENRLEIVRKDSEALIGSREGRIIELKRKIDLLEFNMDLLQDKYSREKDKSAKLRERLEKLGQVVRVAGGLLDPAASSASDVEVKSDGTGSTEQAS